MLPSFLDLHTLLIIVHIFGVALGAGGAFASDAIFFLSIHDRKISLKELAFMRLGSTMVWVGLGILILSGLGLFLQAPEAYLASSKFLAKMTIVAIVTANGIVFHRAHMPRFHRHAGLHYPSSAEFVKHSHLLMISGAISATSWSCAIILGVLRGIPYSYSTIMLVYMAIISIAITVALLGRKQLLGLE